MVEMVVVGSANQDYLVGISSLPRLGETVLANDLRKQPGGKGANQTVAAARLGAEVAFVGCVGDDEDGAQILLQLRTEGVRVGEVEAVAEPTGLAVVYVVDGGDNSIVVVPGANALLQPERVAQAIRRLSGPGAVVVVQAEVSTAVITATLTAAQECGARAVFNLAPFRDLPDDLLRLADPLIVNESEASALVGFPIGSADHPVDVASVLSDRLSTAVVITLGADGAVWSSGATSGWCPAPRAEQVVDTTGAGDAFVGALAHGLGEGRPLASAVAVAVAAGTFAISRPGAQSSYPTRADLAGEAGWDSLDTSG